jgi:hypothetical protein
MHAKTRKTDWIELQKTQANTIGAGVKLHHTFGIKCLFWNVLILSTVFHTFLKIKI